MEKKKKPDNVVFDEESEEYNAGILPYASDLGAPAIEVPDISNWKRNSISKVNHQLQTKFDELREEYNKMMEQYEYNNLIYHALFSFEPVVGETYHLYKRKNEETFLSIIAPHQCNFDHLGSFKLNSEGIWGKVDENTPA